MTRPRDEEVFARDSFRCVYCGFDGRTFEGWKYLQVDHFKPRSRGGSDDMANLMTSCMSCNMMKGAYDFSTLDHARQEIQVWIKQMREYFGKNVAPLVTPRNPSRST